jgi:hypothetical protein
MKPVSAHPARRGAFTRREWLAGGGVVLALLGLAALELHNSSVPVCGSGCATCGSQVSWTLEQYLAGSSNGPGVLTSSPAGRAPGRVEAVPR